MTRAFALARDAKLPAHPSALALCPTMDLAVVACARGGALTAHRLDWTKLWTKTLDPSLDAPRVVAFRPDGKVLVVGYASGAMTTHATEDGRELRSTSGAETFGRARSEDGSADVEEAIAALTWVETSMGCVGAEEATRATRGGVETSASGRDAGGNGARASARGDEGEGARLVDHFETSGKLSALVACDAAGSVAMHVFGMYRVGLWREAGANAGAARAIAVSEDFSSVHAVFGDEKSGAASFARLDSSYVSDHAREVYLMATHASHLKTLLERAKDVLTQASDKYETGYKRPFTKRFDEFEAALRMTAPDSSIANAQFELRERFTVLLGCGTFDESLEHFFMTIFKAGLVKRMAKDCDAALMSAYNGLVATLAPLIDAILLQLRAIRGLARLGFGSEGIGISESRVEDAMKMCEYFAFTVIDISRTLTVRAMQLRAFFVFIMRAQVVADGGDSHGAQLPAPRLELVRDFLDVAFQSGDIRSDLLDHALLRRTDRVMKNSDEFLHLARAATERMRCVGDVKSLHPDVVSLDEMLEHIFSCVDAALDAPCALLSAKCAWMRAGNVEAGAHASMFASANLDGDQRDSFHVDESRDRVHFYRSFDGHYVRTLTLTTPNESIVDARAYKGGSVALLLKPKDASSGAKGRLILMDDDALDALPRDGAHVDMNSITLRERVLPCTQPVAPMAVSVNRGLCAVLVSPTRVQVYDLEDDEDEDDD